MGKNILELEKKYCSQGDTSGRHNPKKVFTGCNGSFLYDENSVAYLDMQMYNSASNFGYRNPAFYTTMIHQMNALPTLASEFISKEKVELATSICTYMEQKYGVKGRVHFNVGGAQAIDDVLKLIANATRSKNIFVFEGCYHGRTMAASSISSSYRYKRQFGSVVDVYRVPFPNCQHCAYGQEKDTCQMFCLKRWEALFQSEYYGIYDKNHNSSAYTAFLAEPILGRGGYVDPPKEYYRLLLPILKKHNILFVADEIQMGMYRTGKLWSFENYNIVPDAFTFGKSITNGLWPLSGVWAKEELISPDIWPSGSAHSTFAGNPLGMALGNTAFSIIKDASFETQLNKQINKFHSIINGLKKDFDFIGRTSMVGMAVGMDIIHPDTHKPFPKLAHTISEDALHCPIQFLDKNYGLILPCVGVYENTFTLAPNLFISDDELNLFDSLIRAYFKKANVQLKE